MEIDFSLQTIPGINSWHSGENTCGGKQDAFPGFQVNLICNLLISDDKNLNPRLFLFQIYFIYHGPWGTTFYPPCPVYSGQLLTKSQCEY